MKSYFHATITLALLSHKFTVFIAEATHISDVRFPFPQNKYQRNSEANKRYSSRSHKKIVGGVEAKVGRYPYMVSLLSDDSHFCGGSLVDSQWILSAAHCAGKATHILIGHHDLTDIPADAEKIEVVFELLHPFFNDDTLNNDVMMIRLATPSTFKTIKINAGGEDLSEGVDTTVMGWGTTKSGGSTSDVLLEVELQLLSEDCCQDAYPADITDSMICAKARNKDSCQGDSGGPLIIKGSDDSTDVQIGIVSWGRGCARIRYPGVYARVAKNYDFITETIESSGSLEGNNGPGDDFDYTKCSVAMPDLVGDGSCDGAEYNSTECNYDGGDCKWCPFPDDNFDYSDCEMESLCTIGDGICDYNALYYACNYDGGDCKSTCDFIDDGFDYGNCQADTPCYIGDGTCDGYGYDAEECNYDGGDCTFPDDGFDYSNCDVSAPHWIGDGYCDGFVYATSGCNHDGGDCPCFVSIFFSLLSFVYP